MMKKGKALIPLLLCLFAANFLGATHIYSKTSGFWSTASTWDLGRVPIATDTVHINGHEIGVDVNANVSKIELSSTNVGVGRLYMVSSKTLSVIGSMHMTKNDNSLNVILDITGQDSIYIGGDLVLSRSSADKTDGDLVIDMKTNGRLHVAGELNYVYGNAGNVAAGIEISLQTNSKLWVNKDVNLTIEDGNSLDFELSGNAEAIFGSNFSVAINGGNDLNVDINGKGYMHVTGNMSIYNSNDKLVNSNASVQVSGTGSSLYVLGNLSLLSAQSSGSTSLNVDGASCMASIRGDIYFSAKTFSKASIDVTNGAKIYHGGNISRGTEGFGSISMSSDAEWHLDGNKPQIMPTNEMLDTGTDFFQFGNVHVNNTSGQPLTLGGPYLINGELVLSNTVIKSSASAPIVFEDGAYAKGANSSAYVDGPVIKRGSVTGEKFLFPTGNKGIYAPIEILVPKSAGAEYSAEYLTCPPPLGGQLSPTTLTTISGTGHWNLTRTANSPEINVVLGWDNADYYGITDTSDLVVAMYNPDSLAWVSLGRSAVSGNLGLNSGSVTSACPPPLGGQMFAFGSTQGLNPLPVVLSKFETRVSGQIVEINWETQSDFDADYFVIERSTNGLNFEPIQMVDAQKNDNNVTKYIERDINPERGANYYRLCQVDNLGMKVFSRIVQETFEAPGIATIFPNPVQDVINIKGDFIVGAYDIEIINTTGKLIAKTSAMGEKDLLQVDISSYENLEIGMYFLRISRNEEVQTMPFLKG